ncbi:AsmA family protein [Vibrio mangrovi]|uniref:AsmA family protein n=1 Tax=Vibrio mangrovi TaxID=474394 RepID=A0A1Y6IYQ9_9VIBR|nr:AsmA family protein [Vibrio mangrovi]MDW6002628.1 AsmA family protein [Vibrio mangrovi]SMS02787.1 putative assembly protein [Vibrio mangrovi]
MKAGVIRVFLVCILLLLTCITLGIIIIQSPYITPVTQWLIQKTWLPTFHTRQVSYQYPYHLQFEQVTFDQETSPIQTLDIWINPYQSHISQLVLDSVLLDGITLTSRDISLLTDIPRVKLNQLAIRNMSVTTADDLAIHGLNIQIQNPDWYQANTSIPYGDIQLHADQVIWQGETLTDLLITGSYQPQNSQIHSLSAKWRGTSLSLQAETDGHRWSINNLTAEKVNLSRSQLNQLEYKFGDVIRKHIQRIDRLDLLNSQLTTPRIRLNNFDLSVSDLSLNKPDFIWGQTHAEVSLDAESLSLDELMWVEPSISISLTPEKMDIDDFSAKFMDGQLHASGEITPETAKIRDLQIQGIKVFIEAGSEPDLTWLKSLIPPLQRVEVEQLKIRNSQIIQLAHQPYWQLSGINTDVDHALLLDHQRWGLWQGSARISVNNLSYDKFIASQGLVEMHNQQDTWILDRLFVPFSKGYLAAKGQWQYGQKGAPWQFSVETDSLPLNLIRQLPFHIQGLADISGSAQGLSGDSVILSHTLSGLLNIDIRDGQLQLPGTKEQPSDFMVHSIEVSGDRGQISIPEIQLKTNNLKATISGAWDLTQSKEGALTLSVKDGEKQTLYNLLDPAKADSSATDSPETDSSKTSQEKSANEP